MPRIRTIKPEFPEDETLGEVSRDARLLFVLIWTRADDVGRFRASPAYLRGQLYPFDDDVTATMVAGWLAELEDAGRVRSYVVRSERYAVVTNWRKHQRVDNAGRSICPSPPFAEDCGDSRTEPNAAGNNGESHGARPPPTTAANRGDSPLDHDHDREGDHDHDRADRDPPPPPAAGSSDGAQEQSEGPGAVVVAELVQKTLKVLARRDLDAAAARGQEIRSRRGLLAKLLTDREAVDGDRVRALVAGHPEWTPERLADAVGRPPPAAPRVREYQPEGVGQGVGFGHPDDLGGEP